jgi:hypothetical protein
LFSFHYITQKITGVPARAPISSTPQSKFRGETQMTNSVPQSGKTGSSRRSFLKRGAFAAGAATVGASLFERGLSASDHDEREDRSGRLTRGDAALLRFAAAAEILETDFWVQYNELGGVQDSEVPGGTGNVAYTNALSVLDADMATYIHDNTDDEFTHQNFLNAYLVSKGAALISLEKFRTLPGSSASGSSGKLRLTNLMQLTLDTCPYRKCYLGRMPLKSATLRE